LAQDSPEAAEPAKMMAADAVASFEVATIEPSNPNDTGDGFHLDGRQIYIENQTFVKLLVFAYGVHPKQVVMGRSGLPPSATTSRACRMRRASQA
jgi:hypothetical protein